MSCVEATEESWIAFNEEMTTSIYHGQESLDLNVTIALAKGAVWDEPGKCFISHRRNHLQLDVSVEVPNNINSDVTANESKVGGFKVCVHALADEDLRQKQHAEGADSGVQLMSLLQSDVSRRKVTFQSEPFSLLDQVLLGRDEEQQISKRNSKRARAVRTIDHSLRRLHFSKATRNNQRSSPLQQYFRLVTMIQADLSDGSSVIVMQKISPRIIVRASNPASFTVSKRRRSLPTLKIDEMIRVDTRRHSWDATIEDDASSNSNSERMSTSTAQAAYETVQNTAPQFEPRLPEPLVAAIPDIPLDLDEFFCVPPSARISNGSDVEHV